MTSPSPSLPARIGYLLGRPLPVEMQDWVRNDVVGPGSVRRYIMRGIVPLLPILIAFAFFPATVIIRICMIALLLIPLVYFQIALIRVYRRHLLMNNGLDPALLEAKRSSQKAATRSEYEAIYRRSHREIEEPR